MKIFILLAVFWYGTSFTRGIRDPSGCRNDGYLHITSPRGANEHKWTIDYQGDMFTAVSWKTVDSKSVQKFSWEVRFNGGVEKFEFEKVGGQSRYKRVTDESLTSRIFNVGAITYPIYYKVSTTIQKTNTVLRVDKVDIIFTTKSRRDEIIRQCSITNIVFNGFCGNIGGNLRITSPEGTNGYEWATGYYGTMFTAVSRMNIDGNDVWRFSWKVEYEGKTEEFKFLWSNSNIKYNRVTKSSDNDGMFNVNTPSTAYTGEIRYVTTRISLKISERELDQINLKFTASRRNHHVIRQCSINNIVFKKCQTDLPLLVNTDSSTYLSEGQFSCTRGYHLITTVLNKDENTKCLKNAKWENQDDFKCYKDCEVTAPLKVNSIPSIYSLSGNFECEDGYHLFPMNTDTYTSCFNNGEWYNQYNLKCYRECKVTPPLLVNSTSSKYSSPGDFYCEDGYHLFPIDTNTSTKCTENEEWENKHDFKCYRAPNDTRIEGNLEIKENEKMEINCNFTQTTPHSYRNMFSFGDDTFVIAENTPFTRKITIEDDGKEVWCHPQSKYTDLSPFLEEGKSPTRKLRVLFAPRAINNDNHTCNWTIGDENSCNFTFKSRPSADDISLFVVNNGTTTIKVDFNFFNSSNGDKQTITIYNIETNELDTRKLQLRVSSSLFPQIPIVFDLILVKETNQQSAIKSSSQLILIIIGISVGIIFIILLILLVVVKKRQTTNKNNNTKPADGGVGGGINEAIYETADDVAGNSVREERCNVIYAGGNFNAAGNSTREERYNVIYESGGIGAAGNSAKEERCNVIYESGDVGAEERVNPLYGSSSGQGSTKKTNIKKNKAGKYNEKKPSQNMNEDSNQLYATIDSNKNMNLRGKRPMQLPQTINDSELYSTVDASKKKNSKGQTSTQDPQNVSELYSTVDATKKKKKKNLPTSSTQETHNVSELYASVDVSHKTGKKSKNETQNSSQLYASVKRK